MLRADVMQDDLLSPFLTVRETLLFSCELRTRGLSPGEREARCDAIIEQLGLARVAHARVGNAMVRGLSGGEKKRLAIGVELVTDPRVLFLDEPTSGLDAANAERIARCAAEQAHKHGERIVITTIHQPRYEVFCTFDLLLLLTRGHVAYFGPTADAAAFFAARGFECSRHVNPADYYIDVLHAAERQAAQSTAHAGAEAERTPLLVAGTGAVNSASAAEAGLAFGFAAADPTPQAPPQAPVIPVSRRADYAYVNSFAVQTRALLRREVLCTLRSPFTTYIRLVQTICIGLLVGSLYWQLGSDQASIQNRTGALFFILINQAFATFPSLQGFIEGRELFLRERGAGCYSPIAYFLATSLVEVPLNCFWPLVLSLVCYWMIGLADSLAHFGLLVVVLMLVSNVAGGMLLAAGSVSPSMKAAQVVAPLTIVVQFLFAGYFVRLSSLPVFYIWLKYVSFFRYAYEVLVSNELRDRTFTCAGAPDGACITNGRAFLDSFGMADVDVRTNLLILLGLAVAYRSLAYLGLRFAYRERR